MKKSLNIVVSLFLTCGVLSGCVSEPVVEKTPVVVKSEEPVQEKPAALLKRHVKDVDLRASLEEKTPKKRIAVLPFLDLNNDRPESALVKARLAFMDDLNKTDEVIAIDSSQLKIEPAKFIKSGEYDMTKLSNALQTSGVNALLEAKIIDLRAKKNTQEQINDDGVKAQFEAVVRMRVVNVRSGKELFHTVKTVTVEDENTRIAERVSSELFLAKNPELVAILIKDAFLNFTNQVVESMDVVTWEGRIAALKGEKIYLNVGRISGVQVGDLLKVVEDSDEIYDPEIGYHVGKASGRVKGTLEVVGYFGQDGAVSVIHSGAGFKENDRVELYQ